jgi:hypothetical protein
MEFIDFVEQLNATEPYVRFSEMIEEYLSTHKITIENLRELEKMETDRISKISLQVADKISVEEFRYLNFGSLMSALDDIDWNKYSADQHSQIVQIYKEKSNLGNYASVLEEREASMEIIRKMTPEKFIEKLYQNKLPSFMRATKFDPDREEEIVRETNCKKPDAYASAHRERLRYMSRASFMVSCMEDQNIICYERREDAMKQIIFMPDDKFIEALKNGLLPSFVRAEYRDPDFKPLYPSYTTDSPESFAIMHKERLRFMEEDEYRNLAGF